MKSSLQDSTETLSPRQAIRSLRLLCRRACTGRLFLPDCFSSGDARIDWRNKRASQKEKLEWGKEEGDYFILLALDGDLAKCLG